MLLAVACNPAPQPPVGATQGAAIGATPAPGTPPIPAKPIGVPPLAKEYILSLATSGTLESYYGYGKALATIWSANIKGVKVTAETAGASVGGIRSLSANQVDMALAQSDIADYAYNGTEMFKDKVANLRAVAVLYPQLVQWVMDPKVITEIADVKGAQIAVGPAGSGSEANTRQILEANGIAYKDLAKALFLSSSEGVDAYDARAIDGVCLTDGVPSPAVTQVANSTNKLGIIPIAGDVAQKVTARYKRFAPATIPAGTYKGVTAAVPTLAVQAVLLVRHDLDDDLVYWLTRTLIEKQADLAQADQLEKSLSKESAVKDLPVPLHPGADRYYREIGAIK
jgi:TRAP transporter TAXI family solute receptor